MEAKTALVLQTLLLVFLNWVLSPKALEDTFAQTELLKFSYFLWSFYLLVIHSRKRHLRKSWTNTVNKIFAVLQATLQSTLKITMHILEDLCYLN